VKILEMELKLVRLFPDWMVSIHKDNAGLRAITVGIERKLVNFFLA